MSISKAKYLREWRKKNRLLVDEFKVSKGCIDCGYNSAPEALHFDHRIPTDKKASIGNMLLSFETIKIEMEKCDIRCANCHAIRTKKEKHWQGRVKS